jgi:Tfp pilus assembly protein FimT
MRLFLKGIKKILGRYQKNRRGFVLVLTLMLITLLSVLAITSFEMVMATTQITSNHKRYLKSLYSADAGIEQTVYVLKKAEAAGLWSGIVWGTPSSLGSLSLNTKDQSSNNWNFSSNIWTMSNTETDCNYSVIVYINGDDAADRQIYVESTGTESGFSKTVVAGIENTPSVRITRWMEKEM